jgi:hypothetical protein
LPSCLTNAHDLDELTRREVLEHPYPAQGPLRPNIAHDLVRDFADDRDIARVPRLWGTLSRLHSGYADHRYNFKGHWFTASSERSERLAPVVGWRDAMKMDEWRKLEMFAR